MPFGSAGDAFDLPALEARLGPADALVVYGRQGEELLACVVRATSVVRAAGAQVFRRLARWHDVLAAWRLALFQLDALCHDETAHSAGCVGRRAVLDLHG